MNRGRTLGVSVLAVLCVVGALGRGLAVAQSAQLQGLIIGRSGASLTVQTPSSGNVVVVLTPATQVQEASGLFHIRKRQLGMAALMPGLPVQVQGAYNSQNQMIADLVKFKSSDLKNAQDIQAGIAPTEQQAKTNQQQIQQDQQQLHQEQQSLKQQQARLTDEQQKIAANQAAITAANKRFGELADYNILAEVTVYFANGSTAIDSQYKPQLVKLAKQAMSINGYTMQVQGYASAVGSAALNQKLSLERAEHVLDFLEQQGGVPMTNILAPGAMGTSDQVGSDSTSEGQATNRRVVVKILQNKAISGA